MRTFLMLMRREIWEHPSLWLTPLIIAGLMLLGVIFIGPLRTDMLGNGLDGWLQEPGGAGRQFPSAGYFAILQLGIGVPFYAAAVLTIISYLLDCLYAERRDRSIVFWKSLPVSDAATVLSKFCVAMIVAPLLFFAMSVLISLPLNALMEQRLPPGSALAALMSHWTFTEWWQAQAIVLYVTLATVLWYAPYAAYLLVVSASARYSVLALAVIPPLLLALLERLLLGTSYVGGIVARSFTDVLNLAFRLSAQLQFTISDVMRLPLHRSGGPAPGTALRFDPSGLLASPQLWIGLAIAALLVGVSISVRKRSRNL